MAFDHASSPQNMVKFCIFFGLIIVNIIHVGIFHAAKISVAQFDSAKFKVLPGFPTVLFTDSYHLNDIKRNLPLVQLGHCLAHKRRRIRRQVGEQIFALKSSQQSLFRRLYLQLSHLGILVIFHHLFHIIPSTGARFGHKVQVLDDIFQEEFWKWNLFQNPYFGPKTKKPQIFNCIAPNFTNLVTKNENFGLCYPNFPSKLLSS